MICKDFKALKCSLNISMTFSEENLSKFQTEALRNITTELDITVQSTEHLFNKTTEEIHPLVDSAEKHLKTVQELKQVSH